MLRFRARIATTDEPLPMVGRAASSYYLGVSQRLKAEVRGGRLVLHDPSTDLPEGAEVELHLVDDRDLDPEERARLLQAIDEAEVEIARGDYVDGMDFANQLLANGRWRTKYHGRKRPDLGPTRSLGEVRETLALLSAKPDLTEAEATKLCNQVADLAHLDGAEVSELRSEAALLVARHEERRELELVERHRSLSARALAGERLTSKERDELAHLSGLLASDH